MLSDIYFRTQTFWINYVGSVLGAVPYKLDIKQKRFYMTFRAQRRCIRVWIVLALQNLFLIATMFYSKKKKDFNAFNHAYLGWVISSIWCIILGSAAFRGELFVYLMNGYITFFERYQTLFIPNYDPNKCSLNHRINFTCGILRWSCLLLACLQCVHSVVNCRSSPFFIDYYIPDEYYTLPVFICTTFTHLGMAVLSATIIMMASVFMLTIAIHLNYIIANDIRCCRKRKYRTADSLRTGHNMRITYRSLVILHSINMEIGGLFLYPMNWLMLKMVVFCGVNLIKYHKLMKPIVRHLVGGWAITGFMFWAMTLELCGYMCQYCERAITSWKYHDWGDDRKVMSKFKKSCKPMKVAYHKIFSIKRISVLKYFRSVAKSLFKAFVAL